MSGSAKGCRTSAVTGWLPRARSAGVGQASGEETAGRISRGGAACSVYGYLRLAGWLWRIAASVGSGRFGEPRSWWDGLTTPLQWRRERALHETFFREFGITGDVVADAERASACFTYTNFLLATAHWSPVEVAVSSVLPCFWIYWEVGKHVRAEATPSNPYRLWIDTYGDEDFGERVCNVIATADAMAASAAPAVLDGMIHAFRRASQLEWMFWDSAYRLETWPV